MKLLGTNAASRLIAVFCFSGLVWLMAAPSATNAAQLKAARVTRIIKDVKLLPGRAAARSAAVDDEVTPDTAVRTGTDSRAELTFADLTITRLGANTLFSFNEGTREVTLGAGAILVQVPRGGADMTISTTAVTAGISGGTGLFESNKGFPTKLLMLEGIGRFYLKGHPEQAVIVHGGEMSMMTLDGRITRPTKFNAGLVYKTAKLITSFPKLPNADLILTIIEQQQVVMMPGTGIFSDIPVDKTDQAIAANPPSPPSAASPKFGRPTPITVPNPYVINAGTVINTDPTITTNGVTDFGKIYRGEPQDGPLATFLGSSPRPFDTAFGDNFQPSPDNLPVPGFLFSALQLDGNPTVLNANNYPLLGLVSQGGISSSPSGPAFTFSGMPQVGLIALSGSIDLSGISFANFGELFVYARGSGSNLNFAAPVSNLQRLQLRAENDLHVSAPITVNGTVQDRRGFKAQAGNNLQISSTVNSTRMQIQSLGGIQIDNSAQLLSMLDAIGNSGEIIMLATGSDTNINVGGVVHADQGLIDIRHQGLNGIISLNNADLHSDVMIAAALGTNGTLNIGAGNVLSADTELNLYAPGSNGTLNFLSSVTLNSPRNILAAHTINIAQGVTVTINSQMPAEVFTDNPHYFGFGGNGTPATTGTFGGAGARNPLPLSQAPPLPPQSN